jgi:hypothetical protein
VRTSTVFTVPPEGSKTETDAVAVLPTGVAGKTVWASSEGAETTSTAAKTKKRFCFVRRRMRTAKRWEAAESEDSGKESVGVIMRQFLRENLLQSASVEDEDSESQHPEP